MNTLIEEFLRKLDHSYKYTTDCERDLIEADLEKIFTTGRNEGIQLAQRWIPVEDELPIKSGNYLCILNGSIFSIAFFTEHKEWIIYKTGQIPEHITSRFLSHWRPIEYPLL